MKSDEYMDTVDGVLNIADLDYTKLFELKTAINDAEVDYFMTDILKAAHRAMLQNDITSFEDYQSDKAVLPANAAKHRIGNLIKVYPERFGIKTKEDFDSVKINVLVLSGGPEGLYLMADVSTDDNISRWMYPPKLPANPDAEEPDGKVNVVVTCNGCTTTNETLIGSEGSCFIIPIIPDKDCTFSKVVINDELYTSMKDVSDNEDLSLAETNNGYKLILHNVTQDTTVEFSCKYDISIKTFRIGGDFVGCSPNCELPIVVNEGQSAVVVVTPNSGYILSQLTIDGIDYTTIFNQGVTEFSHGKLTETEDDDYSLKVTENGVTLKFTCVRDDHNIICHYQVPSYMIIGSGEHVTIEPNPSEVLRNQDRVITITPEEGYHITDILSDFPYIEELTTDDSTIIIFENVTKDINFVVATMSDDETEDPGTPIIPGVNAYSITGFGSHVTIDPNPAGAIEHGDALITITPDEGYEILSIDYDSTNYVSSATAEANGSKILSFTGITGNIQYTVITKAITTSTDPKPTDPENPDTPVETTYTVTGSGEHVTLKPNPVSGLTEHSSATIKITPDDGYMIDTVTSETPYVLDSINGILTFDDICEDITYAVTATAKPSDVVEPIHPTPSDPTYTVTGTGEHVTLSPNPVANVANGGTVTIKVTLDEGYEVTDVVTDHIDTTFVGNIITISGITSDVTYEVTTAATGGTGGGGTNPTEPTDPENPKTYYTVTTNIGATATDDHNIIVTSPEVTSSGSLYTFQVEKDTEMTMNLTSGYMSGNQYLTKMSTVTITDTDSGDRILVTDVNVGTSGEKTTILETSDDIVGSIVTTTNGDTYTYVVTITKISQNLSIAFGTTNVDIGQGTIT